MLTPCGSVGLVVNGHRLQLAVVMTEVDYDFGKTGLEARNRLQVELLPLIARNFRAGDNHSIQHDVPGGEPRLGRSERAALDGKKWEMIVVGHLDVRSNELGRGEKRAHVAVEMRGANSERQGAVDLRADLTVDLRRLRPSRDHSRIVWES